MTIICTDGRTMAADSLQLRGDSMVVNRNRQKLFRMPDGSVVGMAGDASVIAATTKWMLAGMDYEQLPEFPLADPDRAVKGLRLYASGKVELFDGLLCPFETEVPAAIGSADEMAIALLGAGFKPERAVRECYKWCVSIGGPIRTMKPTRKRNR